MRANGDPDAIAIAAGTLTKPATMLDEMPTMTLFRSASIIVSLAQMARYHLVETALIGNWMLLPGSSDTATTMPSGSNRMAHMAAR